MGEALFINCGACVRAFTEDGTKAAGLDAFILEGILFVACPRHTDAGPLFSVAVPTDRMPEPACPPPGGFRH